MKKIAIISDVHSNLSALQAVLDDISNQKVDKIFCLGDIVGYGPFPKECLELVRGVASEIVLGNHDYGVVNKESCFGFNPYAKAGIEFSRNQLSESDFKFINTLDRKKVIDEFDLVLAHGSFSGQSNWEYLDTEEDIVRELKLIPKQICIIGHTHTPFVFSDLQNFYPTELLDDILLNPKEKCAINVGSVGQPRDGDCRASYGILKIGQEIEFCLRRVSYDIESTAFAMKERGLPRLLIDRLFRGI